MDLTKYIQLITNYDFDFRKEPKKQQQHNDHYKKNETLFWEEGFEKEGNSKQ